MSSFVFAVIVLAIIKIAENNKPDREKAIQGLEQFKYPAVNKQMLFDKLEGLRTRAEQMKYQNFILVEKHITMRKI